MEKKLTVTLGDIDQKMVNVLSEVNSKNYLKYRNEFNRASNFNQRYEFPVHVDIELTKSFVCCS